MLMLTLPSSEPQTLAFRTTSTLTSLSVCLVMRNRNRNDM